MKYKTNTTDSDYHAGYDDLAPIRIKRFFSDIRDLQLYECIKRICYIEKYIPVNANYNEMIYGQTVLGMHYFDCSSRTLSKTRLHSKIHLVIYSIYIVIHVQ